MSQIEYIEDFKTPKERTGFDVLFSMIVLLASVFSGYTTYKGFSYDLPQALCVAIAALVFLGLIAFNFRLKEGRINGLPTGKQWIFLCMVLIFSFPSNVNAIYTFWLEKDIVKVVQTEAWGIFKSETTIIDNHISQRILTPEAAKLKRNLDVEVRNFYNQCTDANNPGVGGKAKAHIENIEVILGVVFTRLKQPPINSPISIYKDFCTKYEDAFRGAFAAKHKTSQDKEAEKLIQDIESARNAYRDIFASDQYDRKITETLKDDLESVIARASAISGYERSGNSYIDPGKDEIGSFNYTLENISKGVYVTAIFLAILFALGLDFIAPMISLTMYSEED